MTKETEETRIVNDTWDMGLYKWKGEADGLLLLTDGLKDK